jgi:hypothetical protein
MRFLAAFACLMLMPAVAFAQLQPGSTGGTIGKTDKSISGGEERSEPASRPRREAPTREAATTERSTGSSCRGIVGTWSWVVGTETVFNANGSAHNTSGLTAKWVCANGVVIATWSHGVTNRIELSGNSLTIDGNIRSVRK